MRLLHTADWHVGRTIRGRSRAAEFEAVLAELIEIARDEDVEAMLICGDIWDKATSTPDSDRLVFEALRECVGHGIQAVLLAGNPRQPSQARGARAALRAARRPDAARGAAPERRRGADDRGPRARRAHRRRALHHRGPLRERGGGDGAAGGLVRRVRGRRFGHPARDLRRLRRRAHREHPRDAYLRRRVARGADRRLRASAAHRADLRHQRAAVADDAPVHRARSRARAAGDSRLADSRPPTAARCCSSTSASAASRRSCASSTPCQGSP